MKLITETTLRIELKNKATDEYLINSKTLITPAAREYLRDKNIKLIIQEKGIKIQNKDMKLEKPEYMTHLSKEKLVLKDDLRIAFRGKLDSLQASILEMQILTHKKEINKLTRELEEILDYCRQVLRAEVLGEEFNIWKVIGLDEAELREISHHPKKYFGTEHIIPNYKMGEIFIGLNLLRTKAREAELVAVGAFRKKATIERTDIIKALNRLSSCFYIMMCRYHTGFYAK